MTWSLRGIKNGKTIATGCYCTVDE
jgi:hypothetical protein